MSILESDTALADALIRRVAFLRSRPTVTVSANQAPTCRCRTPFLWRVDATHAWRCFACAPPKDWRDDNVEVIHAVIPGRPVWNAATREWEMIQWEGDMSGDQFVVNFAASAD